MCVRAGVNQRGETVIDYVRWVMVRKRDHARAGARGGRARSARGRRRGRSRRGLPADRPLGFDVALGGSPHLLERLCRRARGSTMSTAMTVEEAEHMIATRLYQNTAKVHFNQLSEGQGRFGRRLIYGGHVISLARALSFNGLANAFHIAAINGGRHVAPLFAGDTVFAWSEILETSVAAGPRRRRRAARADGRDQEPALRRLSLARGRRLRAERHSRFRLLGPRAAPAVTCACRRRDADRHRRAGGDRRSALGSAQQSRRRGRDRLADRALAGGRASAGPCPARFGRARLALCARRARTSLQGLRDAARGRARSSANPPTAPSSARTSRRRSTRSARPRW